MLGGRSLSAPIAALGAGASDMGSGINQIWLYCWD